MANPRKLKAVVDKVDRYSRGVYRVGLSLNDKFPRFRAGQFLHLALDDFDPTMAFWPESRVFSIASCSDDRRKIEFVYSVKGAYTNRMADELEIGKGVWLKGPFGDFIIKKHVGSGKPAFLVAGGTGISPFLPYFKEANKDSRVQLFYGIRSNDLVLFDRELSDCLLKIDFTLDLFVEEGGEETAIRGDYRFHSGPLDVQTVMSRTENRSEGIYFLSGPPTMIAVFQEGLTASGVNEDRIVIDDWG